MSTALGGILRVAFGRLKQRKEQIGFGLGSFVLFLMLVYSMGTSSPKPILSANIQTVFVGNGQTDHENIAAIAVNVINTGTMQTIVKNWRVSIEANGQIYNAAFPIMPESFTFRDIPSATPNSPTSVTLHGSDNMLEKSLTPIQVGAMLPGVLFVVFPNVDKAIFKTGVTYNVIFEDVLSHQYSAQAKSNASVGAVGLTPGLKMDATCPVPPGGLPKLGNDITSSIKPGGSEIAKPATAP
jgi:hypothetical protein